MFFLNFSIAEFVALFSVTSALVVTLYLLNRAKTRKIVPTLRFWVQALRPEASQQRRRIQQPVSLLLQLIALALLLLAVAQPRLGSRDSGARDHVLVLDTSSWMAAGAGGRSLMDEARDAARNYVNRVPAADRIMLVRADGLPLPVTSMSEDREALLKAIEQSRPAAAALDLDKAVAFAAEARKLNARTAGEVVFIGAGRVEEASEAAPLPQSLRVIPVRREFDNIGFRRIGMRRSQSDAGLWDIFVVVRNYGRRPVSAPVVVQFGGAQIGGSSVPLAPGAEQELTFHLRTRAAGWLEARLLGRDALPDDDRVMLEIPEQRSVKVAVFTRDAQAIRPLLASNPFVEATYHAPNQPLPGEKPDVVVLDGYAPAQMPDAGVLWLRPPASAAPIRESVQDVPVVRWRGDHELCAGLHTSAVKLEAADVLTPAPGDVAIAEVESGPVILARPARRRMVLFGYHPGRSDLRYDVLTPLLFANTLRWLKPEAFRTREVHAQTVGTVTVRLDEDDARASGLKVVDDRGEPVPFDVRHRTLRFYAGTPGNIRVIGSRGEQVYSLTLPEVGRSDWRIPASALTGLPPRWSRPLARDIWPWLAALGALLLIIEWALYGRLRNSAPRPVEMPLRASMKRAS